MMRLFTSRYARGGLVAIVATATIAAGQLASFGAQKPPRGLAGEKLASSKGTGGSTAACKASKGSFTFKVSGKAAGPYPGTFAATGSVTVKKYVPARYSATIHITSKQGKVTITESLAKSAGNNAFCLPGYGLAGISARFRATVVIAGHSSRQSGTAAGAVTGGSAKTSALRQFVS